MCTRPAPHSNKAWPLRPPRRPTPPFPTQWVRRPKVQRATCAPVAMPIPTGTTVQLPTRRLSPNMAHTMSAPVTSAPQLPPTPSRPSHPSGCDGPTSNAPPVAQHGTHPRCTLVISGPPSNSNGRARDMYPPPFSSQQVRRSNVQRAARRPARHARDVHTRDKQPPPILMEAHPRHSTPSRPAPDGQNANIHCRQVRFRDGRGIRPLHWPILPYRRSTNMIWKRVPMEARGDVPLFDEDK